jgi:hypothetical protein
MPDEFVRMLGNTAARSMLPVTCSIHHEAYQFDRPGLPHIHERYFCEHIWWCNVCVTWCSPDRQCGHPGTIPTWGVIVMKEIEQ